MKDIDIHFSTRNKREFAADAPLFSWDYVTRKTETVRPTLEEMVRVRDQFFSLRSPLELASLIGISYGRLVYHIYKIRPSERYTSFEIPKKAGGSRSILAPTTAIKLIQRQLALILNCVYSIQVLPDKSHKLNPKPSAHGFTWGRSILSNAAQHARKKLVLNIDLEGFFPSVNFGRVRGMFMGNPYNLPPNVATVLAQICCYKDNGRDELPQGAPTSPVVTNMLCGKMDSDLQKLARRYRVTYTRYADDITLSTSRRVFPEEILTSVSNKGSVATIVGRGLEEIIQKNGFIINTRKVRLQDRRFRQEVTGLTVNEYPNVTRKFVSRTRAMLHAWGKYGLEAAKNDFVRRFSTQGRGGNDSPPAFPRVVRGNIEYIGMIRGKDDSLYNRFMQQYRQLANLPSKEPVAKNEEEQLKRDIVAQLYRHVRRLGRDGPDQTETLRTVKILHARLRETRISVSILYKELRELKQSLGTANSSVQASDAIASSTEAVGDVQDQMRLTSQKISSLIVGIERQLLDSIEDVKEDIREIKSSLGIDPEILADFSFVENAALRETLKKLNHEMVGAEKRDLFPRFCTLAFQQIESVLRWKLRQHKTDQVVALANAIANEIFKSGPTGRRPISSIDDLPNPVILHLTFLMAYGKDFMSEANSKALYWEWFNVMKLRGFDTHADPEVDLDRRISTSTKLSQKTKGFLRGFVKSRFNRYEKLRGQLETLIRSVHEYHYAIVDKEATQDAGSTPITSFEQK